MELSHLFSTVVFLISAIHLTYTLGGLLWARPVEADVWSEKRASLCRDDWYLFFHCSALWGTSQDTPAPRSGAVQQILQTNSPSQPSRPRPRPRAGATF